MVLQNLAGIEDDPGHRVMTALRQMHFPAPWGAPAEGTTTDVERLGIADVREFIATHVRPAGMIIAVAGRIDWEDFVRRIAALFGDWHCGAAQGVAPGPRGPRLRHVPHDSQQTHVALAWSVPPYRSDESYEATAARAALDSCCITRPLFARAFTRSTSSAVIVPGSRSISASITSSVSWARAAVVPA